MIREKVSKKSITKEKQKEPPPAHPAFLMLHDINSDVCNALGLCLGAIITSPKQANIFNGTCKHFVCVHFLLLVIDEKKIYLSHVNLHSTTTCKSSPFDLLLM